MRFLVFDPCDSAEALAECGAEKADLPDLMRRYDFISAQAFGKPFFLDSPPLQRGVVK